MPAAKGPPWQRLLVAGGGAELATLPLLLPRTALWHPLGFLCNLLAGPWLGFLISLGFLYLLATAVLPPAAPHTGSLFSLGCRPFDWLAGLLPSRLFSLPIAEAAAGRLASPGGGGAPAARSRSPAARCC